MTLILCIVLLALLGSPLFVIIGAATAVSFIQYTPEIREFTDLGLWVLAPFENLMGRDPFLAIPLFVATGAIMTEGGLARRLIEFARALLGWLPGGMGMAAVVSCMGFAAISGSSPVTLIAVGSIMFPAMVKAKYPENFSLGLVMTAGSLGCLVAPSLILTIYSLAVMGSPAAAVTTEQMWVAAYVPAFSVMAILCIYCFIVGLKGGERQPFSIKRVVETAVDGVWALALPIIVFFGIKGGFFAPFKAGAVAFTYALVVTTLIHRELDLRKLFKTLADAGRLMGMLILIIALTFSLNQLFALLEVHTKLAELLADWNLGPIGFILLVNVFLIVLGALMDSISATLVFAPILAPIAVTQYGMDPVHFGIVFVVNMEIGYLAPPVATNLFVASALFKKSFGQVSRAVLPGLALTSASLILFIFVPTCSKGLPNLEEAGDLGLVWEGFPWDGERVDDIKRVAGGDEEAVGIGALSEETADRALEDETIDQLDDEDYYGLDGDDEDGGATAVEVVDEDGGTAEAPLRDGAIEPPRDGGVPADAEEEEEVDAGEFEGVQL